MLRAWGVGVTAVCCVLVWACSRGESERPQPTERTAPPAATATARFIEPGAAQLRYAGGRVTLAANAAPVRLLLEQLAAEAPFELQVGPVEWPPLTTSFEDLALAEALPRLIGNRDYTAQWRASASGGEPQLALLRVGAEAALDAPATHPKQRTLPEAAARAGREKSAAGKVAASRARAMRGERQESETQEVLLERLRDPSPQVRMEAAAEIEPEGEGMRALSDLLANDPDPQVRAAATAGLEMSDDPAAVGALLAGLGDPDPAVVIEVLDALGFAGDATVIAHIEPLLEHPDPDVREAARDARDFLGD